MKLSTPIMHKLIAALMIVILALIALPVKPVYAAACNATISGNWTTIAWSCGHVPASADDVTINATRTVSFDAAGTSTVLSLTVNGTLNFNNASGNSLTVSGNVTNAGTIAVVNQAGINTHILSVGGNFTNNGTFTSFSVNDSVNVILNSTAAQTIGGTAATTFNNLNISNSNGITLGANETVNGTLAFTSGKITTGTNTLIVGTSGSASGAGAGKYVYGNLQKNFTTGAQSFIFDIGDATNYTPMAVSFANVSAAGNVTATTTAGEHPNIATSGINSIKDVNRYWTLTSGGGLAFSNYNATLNFVAGDVDGGANTSNFIVQRYSASWTSPTTGTRTATSTQATGLTAMSNFAVGEQAPVATTTTLTADTPDPSVKGESVNVTVAVSGGTTPTGTVDVTGADVNCSITLSGGTGNCNVTFNSVGSKTLAAAYNPDSSHLTSSDTRPHIVNAANTTITLTNDLPDPSLIGQSVIMSYSIAVTAPGSGTPTGNVTVSDGTQSCTGTVAAGTCAITFSSAGSKSLTAAYAGDSNFNTSTSAIESHTVNAAFTTTTITNDLPDPSLVGASVTVNFTVTVNAPGSGTPTGNVTVSDGVDSCTGTVASGTCLITFSSAGSKSLTAAYAGDSNFNTSTSAGESHTVNQGPIITSANSQTITVGSMGTFTLTTTGYPAASIARTGTLPSGVTFADNGDGTGTLTGTPATGTTGSYPLTFTASNGIGSDASQNFTLNVVGGPTVMTNGVNTTPDTGDGRLDENEIVAVGINTFTVKFSNDVQDPLGDSNAEDVTNPANYMLINDNGDGFQTVDCKTGVDPQDFTITVDSATYNNNGGSGPFVATLNINSRLPLSNGNYRLYTCGTTSITDLGGLKLVGNGTTEGTDFIRSFIAQLPDNGGGGNGSGGAFTIGLIPVTGFAPGHPTLLAAQPAEAAYSSFNNLRMEIPSLGVKIPIVGVAYKNNSWDLTWLGRNAGYLDGSAYPTLSGNSVLTGHLVDAAGAPGPFAYIKDLQIGDKIYIHFGGRIFVYEVRENRQVLPTMLSTIFKHEAYNWLTLVTCEGYNNTRKGYNYRRFARAVLISVIPEK